MESNARAPLSPTDPEDATEASPLLSHEDRDVTEASPLLPHENGDASSSVSGSDAAGCFRKNIKTSLSAAGLCLIVLIGLVAAFIVPTAIEEYSKDSIAADIGNISVRNYSDDGVALQINGSILVEAQRVRHPLARTIGRFGTAIFRTAHLAPFQIHVYTLDYNSSELAIIDVPELSVDIQNGHRTPLDISVFGRLASPEQIMVLAKHYLEGSLNSLRVSGKAHIPLRLGVFPLGKRLVSHELILTDLPDLPHYRIGEISVGEKSVEHNRIITASASLVVSNPLVLAADVPALGFVLSLPGCTPESFLDIASATTPPIPIRPATDIRIDVAASISSVPDSLTAVCDETGRSPADTFLADYLHGNPATVYVRGDGLKHDGNSPEWLVDLLRMASIPVSVPPGISPEDMIQSLDISQLGVRMPQPGAKPGTPEATPLITATAKATIQLPKQVHVSLNVTSLRARANLLFEKQSFGVLHAQKWIPIESTMDKETNRLHVIGTMHDVPLNITNYQVFRHVIQELMIKRRNIKLDATGTSDIAVTAAVGNLVARGLPITGSVTVEPPSGFENGPIATCKDLRVGTTTQTTMQLFINAHVLNPTPWTAEVPYVNFLVSSNGAILGNATVWNAHLVRGQSNLYVQINWDPRSYGGERSAAEGRDLVGKFISGYGTNLTLSSHELSLPSMPELSEALSGLEVTIPAPHLPGDDSKQGNHHFIKSATMHVFSSTADFYVQNPFRDDFITIVGMNGTAKYNRSILGTISSSRSFRILPGRRGETVTPRLPVKWRFDSVGYEAMKKAVGGQLKIRAEADCHVAIGQLEMKVFYNGSDPIAAHVSW